MSRPESRMEVEEEEEMVCQHCDTPCWLKEDPCAMAEMKARMEGEATMERDSLEAFFLRLLLLDNIKQEAQVQIFQGAGVHLILLTFPKKVSEGGSTLALP